MNSESSSTVMLSMASRSWSWVIAAIGWVPFVVAKIGWGRRIEDYALGLAPSC
jgi:hypothetical protein